MEEGEGIRQRTPMDMNNGVRIDCGNGERELKGENGTTIIESNKKINK